MRDEDCIFCKIVAGEIPSTKVYEDDLVYAFDDINPLMPVHSLVIPKEHHESLAEELDGAEAAALLAAVRKVAQLKGIDETGFRVISNAGPDSRQEVAHLHLHVLGGGRMNTGNPAE